MLTSKPLAELSFSVAASSICIAFSRICWLSLRITDFPRQVLDLIHLLICVLLEVMDTS